MISVGNLSVAQALHERICLLYAKLEGGAEMAERMASFDREAGRPVVSPNDREGVFKQLVDALCNFEDVTGGEVHPVNQYVAEFAG